MSTRTTIAERAIEVLSAIPPGEKLSSVELARRLGKRSSYLPSCLRLAVLRRQIAREVDERGHGLWYLPGRAEPQQFPNYDDMQARAEIERTRLRDLLTVGDFAPTGDPMHGLSEALEAARKVLARKAGHARFSGAEVDALVARELRQISEAAERAKVNLQHALEVMS